MSKTVEVELFTWAGERMMTITVPCEVVAKAKIIVIHAPGGIERHFAFQNGRYCEVEIFAATKGSA
jgi:hypothetical protein